MSRGPLFTVTPQLIGLVLVIVCVLLPPAALAGQKYHKNKYSADANKVAAAVDDEPRIPAPHVDDNSDEEAAARRQKAIETNELPAATPEKSAPDFRTLPKPFRMAKLNLVWSKAQQVTESIETCGFRRFRGYVYVSFSSIFAHSASPSRSSSRSSPT